MARVAFLCATMLLSGVAIPVRAALVPPAAGLLVPVAVDDQYQLVGDGPLVVGAPGVLENDDQALLGRVVLDGGPDIGSVQLQVDGSFTYTPKTGFRGTDTFRYRIRAALRESDHATVTIEVLDPPPTPKPTPPATPTPSPPPTRSPLPLPTLPLPLPTKAPAPTPTPQPTARPTPSPTRAPTPEPTLAATPRASLGPTPAPATEPSDPPVVGGAGPGAPGPGASDQAGSSFVVPFDQLTDPDRPPVVDTSEIVFGGFEWQVPGLLLSVPGLLVILTVAFQILGGLAWLPVVRRRLGTFRIAHRQST